MGNIPVKLFKLWKLDLRFSLTGDIIISALAANKSEVNHLCYFGRGHCSMGESSKFPKS